MTIFFASDHHFGHTYLVERWRPQFTSVDHMTEELVRRHNAVVKPTDTVFFLGDFAMGRRAETVPIASRLNGHKVLVLGNHDVGFPHGEDKPARMERGLALLLQHFDRAIVGNPRMTVLGHEVTLSHFPPHGDHGEDRYVAHRPADEGVILHGHIHERVVLQHGRWLHVGVDAHDYTPVAAEDLLRLL